MTRHLLLSAFLVLAVSSAAPFVRAQDDAPAPAPAGGRGGGGGQGRGVVAPPAGAARGGGGGANTADPANATADFTPKPPVPPLSPEEELKHLILPPG